MTLFEVLIAGEASNRQAEDDAHKQHRQKDTCSQMFTLFSLRLTLAHFRRVFLLTISFTMELLLLLLLLLPVVP